jgi:transposase
MSYRRGQSRYQQSFLSVDDLISKGHPIREIDRICEEYVNPDQLEVDKGHQETGRPAYHPSDLIKILVYGYFNGINSSRKLERECGRNIELKWLTGDLVPDHKTIADFRRGNSELIRGLFKYLVVEFKNQHLVKGHQIAVDGSKIKANARGEKDIDVLAKKLENIEVQSAKYLKDMELIDQAEDDIEELAKKKAELEKELAELALKKKSYEDSISLLKEVGERRISTTDVDSRMMRGRYGNYWGYNVQTAVDADSHMVTAIEVTNQQNDKGLLEPMVKASQATTGQKVDEVLADGGYYKIDQLAQLEGEPTQCYVAINKTPSQAKDQINNIIFTYVNQEDRYYCGEGKPLDYRRKKRTGRVYTGRACSGCTKKSVCTTVDGRSIYRNENQEWIDTFHAKMGSNEGRDKLKKRRSVAEHPFGTMKYSMGQIPLLLRGKEKVQIEMNLHAIGYNLKRYFALKGHPTTKTGLAA